MITIFKTPTCAYCRQVCTFLDRKGVVYQLEEAQGERYVGLADLFGMTVPLIYNDATEAGMVGYDIPRIMAVVGLQTMCGDNGCVFVPDHLIKHSWEYVDAGMGR